MKTKPKTDLKPAKASPGSVNFPLEMSVGYQVRMTHRALQRYLQGKIEPYGVTLGMWYFLRALWHEDGLTQRELSHRIGTMEPTTLHAILTMERSGLVKRVRDKVDKRKIHIHLTPKGHKLKDELLPLAVSVVSTATKTLSSRDITRLLKMLSVVQSNIDLEGADADE